MPDLVATSPHNGFKNGCEQHGDGDTSRDFCYVGDVVQANILATTTKNPQAIDEVYNIAYGETTTLNALHQIMANTLAATRPGLCVRPAVHRDFRVGDVRYSLADISKAKQLLGYSPTHAVRSGLVETINWYISKLNRNSAGTKNGRRNNAGARGNVHG